MLEMLSCSEDGLTRCADKSARVRSVKLQLFTVSFPSFVVAKMDSASSVSVCWMVVKLLCIMVNSPALFEREDPINDVASFFREMDWRFKLLRVRSEDSPNVMRGEVSVREVSQANVHLLISAVPARERTVDSSGAVPVNVNVISFRITVLVVLVEVMIG